MTTLLEVDRLVTEFDTREGRLRAVDEVSFSLRAGEVLGLVGESGSGKSVTGFSILGLIDPPGRITSGRVCFEGEDLVRARPGRLREIRGDRIAMIFQDPAMTLNPVLRIDTQMIEALTAHHPIRRAEARQRCIDALTRVGIASAAERLEQYPHQFSGGMRQRVAIAIALLNRPALLIADEPTTALDVTVQGQILHAMRELVRAAGTALIWITHDLAVVAGLADRIAVMYAGRIVETGPIAAVLDCPRHPYTRGLLASVPANNAPGRPLRQIPGMMPSPLDLPTGCAFRPRCDRAQSDCVLPLGETVADDRSWRCRHPLVIDGR